MPPTLPTEILPLTAQRAPDGRLLIGGCALEVLAAEYGTPLYLYDQATLDEAVTTYQVALAAHWPGVAEVAYAAKAWLSTALAQWATARGLGMDVVSEGELRHALHAGFPAARIHAHGNNKPDTFLRACVTEGVGRVVIDHPREAERLADMAAEQGTRPAVWLRLNPATAAQTHASIETGSATSKFGLSLQDGSAWQVAQRLIGHEWLDWRGVHFHIGSQFSDTRALREAIHRLCHWLGEVRATLGWAAAEFSPGGGWAVPYRPGDPHLPPAVAILELAATLQAALERHTLPWPALILEPGREVVARAGVALYSVGALKEAGGLRYAFLDGGLADNPRPALYDARYHALLANRESGELPIAYALAGPFCESGDVLIREVALPPLREGDLIAIPVSGAYQLSMASTYNGTPRPAVLWLHQGRAHLVQHRESLAALWERDELLPSL